MHGALSSPTNCGAGAERHKSMLHTAANVSAQQRGRNNKCRTPCPGKQCHAGVQHSLTSRARCSGPATAPVFFLDPADPPSNSTLNSIFRHAWALFPAPSAAQRPGRQRMQHENLGSWRAYLRPGVGQLHVPVTQLLPQHADLQGGDARDCVAW